MGTKLPPLPTTVPYRELERTGTCTCSELLTSKVGPYRGRVFVYDPLVPGFMQFLRSLGRKAVSNPNGTWALSGNRYFAGWRFITEYSAKNLCSRCFRTQTSYLGSYLTASTGFRVKASEFHIRRLEDPHTWGYKFAQCGIYNGGCSESLSIYH